MDEGWDRQTYFIKEILKRRFWMQRGDWHYGQDWFEGWMMWEDLDEYPQWTIDHVAALLADYLRTTIGWTVTILDWTAANVAQQNAEGGGAAGPAHAAPNG